MFGTNNKNTFAAMRKRNEARRREELRKQAMSAKPNYTRADFSPPPPTPKDPPRNINPNTGMRDRRSGVERVLSRVHPSNWLATKAARAFSSGLAKEIGKVAGSSGTTRRRVNPANFPMQGYAKRKSTRADQPARARFRGSRRAASRVSLRIPSLGGF